MNWKILRKKELVGCIIGSFLSMPIIDCVLYQQTYFKGIVPTLLSLDMAVVGLPLLSICLYRLFQPIFRDDGSGETIRRTTYA